MANRSASESRGETGRPGTRVKICGVTRIEDAQLASGLGAHVPGLPGGTGERFDWELAAEHHSDIPLILSGGLRPENVSEAIAAARPFAVDVASGVESSPGRKDPDRLERFFKAVAETVP